MATIKPVRKVQTQNKELNRVQENLQEFNKQVISNPLLNGQLLTDVTSVASTFTLRHNMGRPISGAVVTNIDGTFTDGPFIRIISSTSTTAEVEGNYAGIINVYVF